MTFRDARTRASIGVDNGNALLAGTMLKEAFLGAIVTSTGQAREIEENGNLCARFESLGRQVKVERHVGIGARRFVLQLQKLAPEGGNGRCSLETHGVDGLV